MNAAYLRGFRQTDRKSRFKVTPACRGFSGTIRRDRLVAARNQSVTTGVMYFTKDKTLLTIAGLHASRQIVSKMNPKCKMCEILFD